MATSIEAEASRSPAFDTAGAMGSINRSETNRLNSLHCTGLLGTPAEDGFDRLTRLASQLLVAPVALISFIDDSHQFLKSAVGLAEPWASQREFPLSYSLCKHVVSRRDTVSVTDTREDALLRDSPAVTELNAIAYLGLPLFTPDSEVIGTFCVIDHSPRHWTSGEIRDMEDFAKLASNEVAAHWRHHEQERLSKAFRCHGNFAACIADISPAVLYVYSVPEARILYVNRESWHALGYTPEQLEAFGATVLATLMHPADLTRYYSHLDQLRETKDGETLGFEYRMRHAKGEWRWFYSRDTVLTRNFDGSVCQLAGSAIDCTAAKEAEEALRESARRKDEFLAMLAHELRNPLAAIRNAVLLASEPAIDSDVLTWSRGVVDRQSLQLVRIVDDLLDVSRIARGKIRLSKTLVDVRAIGQHLAETLQPLLDERHHVLHLCVPAEPAWVTGDPARLEQIIVNLLTNAIKYSDDGAQTVLGIRTEEEEVVVMVRDTGIGIDPETLPRIFDLFEQSTASLDRAKGGIGIGLSLVRRLAELHGGSVTAHSEGFGTGSEFVVRLPRSHGNAEAPPDSHQDSAEDPHGITTSSGETALVPARILIVDDHVDAARGLSRLLERRGYEVRSVNDGLAALGVAREFLPQIVLLDIGLPTMDGYEVAKYLRMEGFEDTRLIALTGYGQEADLQHSRAAGFDCHLIKPVDFDALLAVLAAPDTNKHSYCGAE